MSHWFLVARDLMWVLLTLAPIFLASIAGHGLGQISEDELDEGGGIFLFVLYSLALAIQLSGISALYYGHIK